MTFGQTVLNPNPGASPAAPGGGADAASIAAPVFIDDCSRRPANTGPIQQGFQQIVVEEMNERREVVLRAGNKYIGVLGNALADRIPLELQDFNGGPGQLFALDGDSIILAADRGLVIEIKNGKGANGTPLVLGRRDLNDVEFWDFSAVDGRALSLAGREDDASGRRARAGGQRPRTSRRDSARSNGDHLLHVTARGFKCPCGTGTRRAGMD